MKKFWLVLILVSLIISSSALQAAALYWDGGGTSGASLGGSGNWDVTSPLWFNGTSDVVWPDLSSEDAIFTGTPGTVTVAVPIIAADLYFTNISGVMEITNTAAGTLTLDNGIVDTGGTTDILAAPLEGSTTLTKNGGGILELNGANSGFSGAVQVNQGTIEAENTAALGTGAVTVTNAGSVEFTPGGTFANAFFISGPGITSGTTNLGALINITNTTILSALLTVESTNTVIGSEAGILDAEGGITSPSGLNPNLTFQGLGSVRLSYTSTANAVNIGTGAIILNGANVNNESKSLTSSNLVINGGLYATANSDAGFGKDPSAFESNNISMSNGGIVQISHTFTFGSTRGFYLGIGGGGLQENTGSATPTIPGVISGPGPLHIEADGGSAYWKFTGNNTYSGGTLIDSGSGLFVGGASATSTTGTFGTGNVTNNGTLTVSRAGTFTYGGTIINSGTMSLVSYGSGIFTFSGPLTGTGSLALSQSGTVILAGASTYTGNTTDNAQFLLVDNTNASGTGTGDLTVGSATTGAFLGGTGIISGPVTIDAGNTLQPGIISLDSVGTLTISNSLTLQPGSMTTLELDATVPASSAVVGMSSITYGGSLNVNLINGTPAAGQTYQLFGAKSYSGGFELGISLPSLNSGLVWNTNNLYVNGTISVVPQTGMINTPVLSGTNLILTGSSGIPYGTFSVLASTNLALPFSAWTVLSSGNSYDGNGNFDITNAVNPNLPQEFFIISQ
jgi:fibronectin-binding autotransporter adhesin